LPTLTGDEIAGSPALKRIASHGAVLTDLGTEHGLRTVFARNGSTFQVFYLAPDGQALVGGVMWDSTGHNITMFFDEAELPYRLPRAAGPTLTR